MLRLTEAKLFELRQAAINQSLEVVRRRIDELGTREASIQRQGADRILVQVPGEKNPENIKRLLGRTARLTFHMVDLGASVQEALQGRVPPGSMLLESAERDGGSSSHYVVKRQVELSGENLTDAQPSFQDNQPVVSFRLRQCRCAQVRQDHAGECRQAVRDRARRQGDLGPQHPRADPRRLGHHLRQLHGRSRPTSCPCSCAPVPCRRRLKVIEERSVGAELGADSIRCGHDRQHRGVGARGRADAHLLRHLRG